MDLDLQELIDSGGAWRLEGSIGRAAMEALRSGACVLPLASHTDAYGNRVPGRDEIDDVVGSPGSLANARAYAGAAA